MRGESTTTCETAPATFAGVVDSVVSGMFQNVMGNDPRPGYVHQTNIMGHRPPGPATTGTAAGDLAEHRRRALLLGDEPAA